jgi:hypothetical protein
LIGFANVAIGNLFDNLSCRRVGSRSELCPLIRKDLSTYRRRLWCCVSRALFGRRRYDVASSRLAPLHGPVRHCRACPRHPRRPAAPAFPALLAARSAKPCGLGQAGPRGWPGIGRSEERPSFDGLCPAMTENGMESMTLPVCFSLDAQKRAGKAAAAASGISGGAFICQCLCRRPRCK